nr:hypothetical protein Itr_chr13CG14740 [Ipomoea trifida]GMD76418.1 hypothetical protein Iba_chr13bCG10180 [Ipomoea batatas]
MMNKGKLQNHFNRKCTRKQENCINFPKRQSGDSPGTRSSPLSHIVAMPKRSTVHHQELSLVAVGCPASLPLESEVAWWWSTFAGIQPACVVRPPHRSPTITPSA